MFLNDKSIILSILFTLQSVAFSQNATHYQLRENRYEGIKPIGVSAPDLELISFTAYRQEIPPDSNVVLKLKFFMPMDSTLYIAAKELVPRRYYFMESVVTRWQKGWQQFIPWPTAEVLKRIDLLPKQLGMVARLYQNRIGSGHIVPLVVYYSNSSPVLDQYHLHLRAKETLSRVQYVLYKSNDRQSVIPKKILRNLSAREPFTIILELSFLPEGEYRLLIKSRIKNKIGGPSRTYTFYHKPVID